MLYKEGDKVRVTPVMNKHVATVVKTPKNDIGLYNCYKVEYEFADKKLEIYNCWKTVYEFELKHYG